jgi:putative addiction module component (TIGR02574 family)
MSDQLKQIEEQALLLPAEDRKMLANRLLDSLDDAPLTDIDEAWIEEAEIRYQRLKAGITQGIPQEKIFADIRRELGWQK